MLGTAVEEAHRKVESGRVRDAENEKVRQGWIRVLAYAASSFRQLKRDEELEELAERVAMLEGTRAPLRAGRVDVPVDGDLE